MANYRPGRDFSDVATGFEIRWLADIEADIARQISALAELHFKRQALLKRFRSRRKAKSRKGPDQ